MKSSHFFKAMAMAVGVAMLGACQTLSGTSVGTTKMVNGTPKFDITGKIGVTTKTAEGVQAGSAFYTWGQVDGRFSIELTGALGMGATNITFDGKTAKLMSDHTGEISADSPETLLLKATGWQAPISQLPFWVLGQTAPDDTDMAYEGERLSKSTNGEWQAQFEYAKKATEPNRLTIHHLDGHKVVMTITHLD